MTTQERSTVMQNGELGKLKGMEGAAVKRISVAERLGDVDDSPPRTTHMK